MVEKINFKQMLLIELSINQKIHKKNINNKNSAKSAY